MNYKNAALSLIFIVIVIFVYFHWESIIVKKRNQDRGYVCENDIDIIFIGTSKPWAALSPMYIWDKYGIVSYNRSSEGQSYKVSYFLMKDAVENHNTKVIVFDISFLLQKANRSIYFVSDVPVMLPIKERFNAYKSVYGNGFSYDKMNIADKFHTRWKELSYKDFTYERYLKGFFPYTSFFRYQGPFNFKNEKVKLYDETIDYAKRMQEYADSKGVKLIFISIPDVRAHRGYTEAFEELATQNGWTYFNYYSLSNNIGFNYKTDLLDAYHTNYYGGKKIIDHLIPYIIKNFNIPNKKDDPQYISWNQDYLKYARVVNMQEVKRIKLFTEWQNKAVYDNYTVLISSNGDNVLNRLPQDMKDKFKTLGLNKFETNKNNQKYVAIIDNGKVFFEEISDKKVEYKGRMNNKVNLLVSSENKQATINVSGKPRSKNKYGINFVIYDKVNREIVDSIWLDPSNFNQVCR